MTKVTSEKKWPNTYAEGEGKALATALNSEAIYLMVPVQVSSEVQIAKITINTWSTKSTGDQDFMGMEGTFSLTIHLLKTGLRHTVRIVWGEVRFLFTVDLFHYFLLLKNNVKRKFK